MCLRRWCCPVDVYHRHLDGAGTGLRIVDPPLNEGVDVLSAGVCDKTPRRAVTERDRCADSGAGVVVDHNGAIRVIPDIPVPSVIRSDVVDERVHGLAVGAVVASGSMTGLVGLLVSTNSTVSIAGCRVEEVHGAHYDQLQIPVRPDRDSSHLDETVDRVLGFGDSGLGRTDWHSDTG